MAASVLFVDDEKKILDAHRRSFRAYKDAWTLRYASSGEEALALMRDAPADVVVSDLAMPGMKGLELVAAIKADNPETQCIILTGTADMQAALDAINRVDVFRFYLKPCASEALAQGIRDALASMEASRKEQDGRLDIGKAALDSLPYGVFVVSPDGNVLFVNVFATELVKAGAGLSIGHDRTLKAWRPADTRALQDAVAAVTAPGAPAHEQAMFVERESGERPLSCVVQRFSDVAVEDEEDGRAAIFVTDPERTPAVSPEVLAGLFDLTASESRLLSCLVASGRLEQAADDANLTLSTARTYLKQIFAKTGTGRQGELIQMVLLSPAVIKSRRAPARGSET